MQELAGKIALVSGSASGIGKAAACLLAREGAWVLATDSDAAGAAQTSREISESGGRHLRTSGPRGRYCVG